MIGRARAKLAGRTVVVTGASSGIGRAFVEAMAPSRARFVLVARRESLLEEVARTVRSAGGEALVQAIDLRDRDAARRAAEQALAGFGAPDLLLANAGHAIARSVGGCIERPDTIIRSADANYVGPIVHALPLLGAMMSRGGGQLVASSTVNARTSVPGWSAYVSSKAAWDAWLRSVEPELRLAGVATSIVAFPLVATPMVEPTRGAHPRGAMSTTAAVRWLAKAVVRRSPRVAPFWLKPYEVLHALAPVTTSRGTGRFSTRLVP